MLENAIGKRYADALSRSIPDDSKLDGALEHLNSLNQAFTDQPELKRFFSHPGIPLDRKEEMVRNLCSQMNIGTEILNLALMLTERLKILFLGSIVAHFEKAVDARLNQVRVSAVGTYALDADQVNRLTEALNRILGKKIIIETRVDASILGGLIVQIGDQVADASLRNSLSIMKQAIEK